MDLLQILQVDRVLQHNSTYVQNPLSWQLKREQWPFVEKTKANCLYKYTDKFSIGDNTICQLGYN